MQQINHIHCPVCHQSMHPKSQFCKNCEEMKTRFFAPIGREYKEKVTQKCGKCDYTWETYN